MPLGLRKHFDNKIYKILDNQGFNNLQIETINNVTN